MFPAVSKGMEQNNVELEAFKGGGELSHSLKSYKNKKDFLHPPLLVLEGKRQSFGVDPSWIWDFPGGFSRNGGNGAVLDSNSRGIGLGMLGGFWDNSSDTPNLFLASPKTLLATPN